MDISLFLAQAFGLFLVLGGIAFLVHPFAVKEMIDVFSTNRAAVMSGGFFSLVIGIPLVLIHSIWDGAPYQTVISALAWITFLKGCARLLIPNTVIGWGHAFRGNTRALQILVALMTAVGVYLLYIGFVVLV